MLSVIVCSISPERLRQISLNIENTIGIEHEIIVIDNREKKWSIAGAYNEGARQAHFTNLFFVHEDVKFHSQDWGLIIEDKLKEPDCGVIGFAGSKVKLRSYSGWLHRHDFISALYCQRKGCAIQLEAANVKLEHPFEEVVTLDGLGMFVRKDVWKLYPFDEKLLTGFHCYDLDFTLQIAADKKYKNYVCCSLGVLIEHFSEGNYDRSWYQDTIRMHKEKWNAILPLKVDSLVISEKAMKRLEEHCFNKFLYGLLKTSYPERKTILKEFIVYPFSWKHFGHCILNVYKYVTT